MKIVYSIILSLVFLDLGLSASAAEQSLFCQKFTVNSVLLAAEQDIKGIEKPACDGNENCLGQKPELILLRLLDQSGSSIIRETYLARVKGFQGKLVTYKISVDSTDIAFCELNTLKRIR